MNKLHFTPVHPGAVLQDELEEIGSTQSGLAKHIGVLPKTINEISFKSTLPEIISFSIVCGVQKTAFAFFHNSFLLSGLTVPVKIINSNQDEILLIIIT